MASIRASVNPVLIDVDQGAMVGTSTITYDKWRDDELWMRRDGAGWEWLKHPEDIPGLVGPAPDIAGSFVVALAPGEFIEFGVFTTERGPESDPDLLARVELSGLARRHRSDLILSTDQNTGGTWHAHVVTTDVDTRLAVVAACRAPVLVDADDYPHVDASGGVDGVLLATGAWGTTHELRIDGILPGSHYHLLVLVVDPGGRWDYRIAEFDALRRELTVQFTTLHIYNDGDPSSVGEAQFRFWVDYRLGVGQFDRIREFFRPGADIDDWGETDRPYPLGFAYVSGPQQVLDGQQHVYVSSIGHEDDGWEGDEVAWSVPPRPIVPPIGPGETVTGAGFLLDCPPAAQDDFHYGVDVTWSVHYS